MRSKNSSFNHKKNDKPSTITKNQIKDTKSFPNMPSPKKQSGSGFDEYDEDLDYDSPRSDSSQKELHQNPISNLSDEHFNSDNMIQFIQKEASSNKSKNQKNENQPSSPHSTSKKKKSPLSVYDDHDFETDENQYDVSKNKEIDYPKEYYKNKCQSYQSQIDELQERIEYLQSKNESYKNKLQKSKNYILEIEDENHNLRKKIASQKKKLELATNQLEDSQRFQNIYKKYKRIQSVIQRCIQMELIKDPNEIQYEEEEEEAIEEEISST